MKRTQPVTLTNMCMIQKGSQVLVQEKMIEGKRGITFPGGHVEGEEPILSSVIREVKEESGLSLIRPRLCGIKDFIEEDGERYLVFLFRAEEFFGELTSSREGRVFWAERGELFCLPWIWDLESLLQVFEGEYSEVYLTAREGYLPHLL